MTVKQVCLLLIVISLVAFTAPVDAMKVTSYHNLGDGTGGVTVHVKYGSRDYIIKAMQVSINSVGRFVIIDPAAKAKYGKEVIIPLENIKAIIYGDYLFEY